MRRVRIGLMDCGTIGRQLYELAAVIGSHHARLLNGYDNEWGCSSRACDLIARLGALGPVPGRG